MHKISYSQIKKLCLSLDPVHQEYFCLYEHIQNQCVQILRIFLYFRYLEYFLYHFYHLCISKLGQQSQRSLV